jgi:hypothetical protein
VEGIKTTLQDFTAQKKPYESNSIAQWKATFKETFKQSKQCVILLISPPGVGKTHMIEHDIEPEETRLGTHVVRFDCSNDELVERSMVSLLKRSFPNEGKPSLLVADEYHMLIKEHKQELLSWAR